MRRWFRSAGQPVTVTVEAADPHGVAAVDLKFSVAGGGVADRWR